MPRKLQANISVEHNTSLKNFLSLSYENLEELNLAAKANREKLSVIQQEREYRAYLEDEKRIKAVTVCFTSLEGRLFMLDYDKKFLLQASENLTFDGSSVRGFTRQAESDLRLSLDWTSFYWLPSDIFGEGKVMLFANVMDRDKLQYQMDLRGQLQLYLERLKKTQNIIAYAAPELEGHLVAGQNAEQRYQEDTGLQLVTTGGYFSSLPLDLLRQFIDKAAEAQRAMGFHNEKDHPEVAPSEFELNFSYGPALHICDQIQLYKLICRQVAHSMGMTATFLPKPIAGINGNGMHTNMSLGKAGKNIFYDAKGINGLSQTAWNFINRILNHADELCLTINSSVNSYRRLDPHFEAPNEIKVTPNDRGSMIRIPTGNEKSARIEVRSVSPDSNPYLALYTLIRTGFEGTNEKAKKETKTLPGNVYEALGLFESSTFMEKILGKEVKEKYASLKREVAGRSPRELGAIVKTSEVIYHHEVLNQVLWNKF
ncbi:MAG TPA: glutamine synthetase family protein [Patescibacteria group bacterium]|nr:glutamine synthetase family protein [Patescibacteria group bacterium]